MATRHLHTVIHHLRTAMLVRDRTGPTDEQLLAAFLEQQDEAAFAALVRRHGPMVWGVCRRLLNSHHDAEDAFQATFLVLVRKAASVVPRERVANWLYGVAYTTAHRAKVATAKRRVRERQVPAMPEPEAVPLDLGNDLRSLLDQELSRLPDKYRLPLVLCDLEGQSIKGAARQLGWPQGTLAGRLARGRKLLAKRLTQRGVVLSGGLLAGVLLEKAASACMPTSLVSSTVKAGNLLVAGQATAVGVISAPVLALMEGVLKAMVLTKLKTVTAALLVVSLTVLGGGVVTNHMATAQQADSKENGLTPAVRPMGQPRGDARFLVGFVDSGTVDRPEVPPRTDREMLEANWIGERRPLPRVIGVGVNSDAGLSGTVVVNERNFDVAQTDQEKNKGRLPSGVAPTQALVSLANDGQLVVQTRNLYYEPTTTEVQGRKVTSYKLKEALTTTCHHPREVRIYDVKGKRIDPEGLPKLLEQETLGLVKSDGLPLDLRHLQLYKEGTLLFVLPSPAPPPLADPAPPPVDAPNQDAGPAKSDKDRNMFPKGRAHDFGTLRRGTVATFRFPIVNPSNAPVRFTSVRISSACLTASVSKEVLPPNGKGELEVALDTQRFAGSKTVSVLLTAECGGVEEIISFSVRATSQE